MSLLSLCKSGNFEGARVALGRGELDTMSCAEKFDCLESARRSKENASRLALALIKQLGFDQFQQIFDWVGSAAFYSLHAHCLKKGLASMPGSGQAEMIQQIPIYLVLVCTSLKNVAVTL